MKILIFLIFLLRQSHWILNPTYDRQGSPDYGRSASPECGRYHRYLNFHPLLSSSFFFFFWKIDCFLFGTNSLNFLTSPMFLSFSTADHQLEGEHEGHNRRSICWFLCLIARFATNNGLVCLGQRTYSFWHAVLVSSSLDANFISYYFHHWNLLDALILRYQFALVL